MLNSDLHPQLHKINKNQLLPKAAFTKLTHCVEMRESVALADNVHGALEMIDSNEEFIMLTFATLIKPEQIAKGNILYDRRLYKA